MARWMPELETFFHYRNLDVSTLKELCRRWQPAIYKGFQKRAMHTALADIHESIDELKYYREHFLIPSASGREWSRRFKRERVRILAAGSRFSA